MRYVIEITTPSGNTFSSGELEIVPGGEQSTLNLLMSAWSVERTHFDLENNGDHALFKRELYEQCVVALVKVV